jgi:hypothetical protein
MGRATNEFWLDKDGKEQYHPMCKDCIHKCKQSFRVTEVICKRKKTKKVDTDKK